MKVGFVGVGRMGNPICRHVLQAGLELTVFDVQAEAMEKLVALGARAATSACQVAQQSQVVLVMVADDAQVRHVVAGPSGITEGAHPDLTLAILSTIHPDTCRELARVARQVGIGFVDAPVARGMRGAEAGDLTVFCGGEKEDVEKCRPVFAAYAHAIFHMGPVGAGEITKACNNLMHWAEIVACCETLDLGRRLGISPSALRAAMLAGSADSRTLRELEQINMTWPDKDLATALALADENDVSLPLMHHVRELVKNITRDDLRAFFKSGDGIHGTT